MSYQVNHMVVSGITAPILPYDFTIPKAFEYFKPSSLEEAVGLLVRHNESGGEARILAGGQSLLVLMRQRVLRPGYLIDIKGLPELSVIEHNEEGLRIGAAATFTDIVASSAVREHVPILARVLDQIGSIHIRNRGTIGGTICHADPTFDTIPVLGVLGAQAVIVGPQGSRRIAVEEVASDFFKTQLAPNEILTEILVPPQQSGSRSGYANYRRRGGEFPLVGAAVRLSLSDGNVDGAKILLSGAGPTPFRASSSEESLVGSSPDDSAIAHAGELVRAEVNPISDARGGAEWRKQLCRTVVVRAIQDALSG